MERELGSQAMRTRAVMVANALKRATNRGIRGGTDVEIRLTSGSSMSALTRFGTASSPPNGPDARLPAAHCDWNRDTRGHRIVELRYANARAGELTCQAEAVSLADPCLGRSR